MKAKFEIGNTVFVDGRCPQYLDILRHRPRTIIAIRYHPDLQANLYMLGSNHQSHEAEIVQFRSYELKHIEDMPKVGKPRQKRQYHFHRAYTYNRGNVETDTMSSENSLMPTVLVNQNGRFERVAIEEHRGGSGNGENQL